MTNEVSNDTEVFYAKRFDIIVGDYVLTDDHRMGTREAINRAGLKTDPVSREFCPHQWIGQDGYVDQELADMYPLSALAALTTD
jgi:hypothetical protein